jgi:hypothetical protein
VLDRKPITLNERVQAFHRHCVAGSHKARELAAALFKWRLVLVAQYGQGAVAALRGSGGFRDTNEAVGDSEHKSVEASSADGDSGDAGTAAALFASPREPHGYLTRLRTLSMPSAGLTLVDVRGLAALEALDLSGNNLLVSGRHSLRFCCSSCVVAAP